MTISGSSLREENLRDYAHGEIFLLRKAHHHLGAKVYDTTGFGPVRAGEFDAIDVERLAADTRSDLAWKNPRRFWTADATTIILGGQPRELQGLMFNLVARMHLPVTFDPRQDQSAPAYQPTQLCDQCCLERRAQVRPSGAEAGRQPSRRRLRRSDVR